MLILPCTPAMAFPPSFRVIGPIYHELKLQTFSSYKLIVSDVASLWLGTVFKVDVRGNSWPCFWVRCCFLIWGAHRADWTPFLLSGSPECPDTPRKLKVHRRMETTPTGGKEKLWMPLGPCWCCGTPVWYRILSFGEVGTLHPVSCCEQWNLILFTHGFPGIFSCFLLFNF